MSGNLTKNPEDGYVPDRKFNRRRLSDYESDIHDMDIILCRNVFIYFDSDKTSSVLDKMKNTLREGGYLITGHTRAARSKSSWAADKGYFLSRLPTRNLPR